MPVDGLSLIHVSAFIVYNNGEYYYLNNTIEKPWNNGKEVPRWGVAEIQKMSPSTTGGCIKQGSGDRQPMGPRHSDTAANHTDLLYLTSRRGRKNYIRRPDVVERIGSYLPPEFPLFHAAAPLI